EPVQVRHADVHEGKVDLLAGSEHLERGGRTLGLQHLSIREAFLHHVMHATAHERVVVHDQDPHRSSPCTPTGSTAMTHTPRPGVDSISIEPPIWAARACISRRPKCGSSSVIAAMP